MAFYRIDLGISVPQEFAADVCDRLRYAHRAIESVSVDGMDSRHMVVVTAEEVALEVLQPILARSVKEMLKAGLSGTTVVLKDRRSQVAPPVKNAFAELLDRGYVHFTSRGSLAKRGPAFRLMRFLDHRFRNIALEFGALELELPSCIGSETLYKAGHFNASPQHITFASHLTEDLDFLKLVSESARKGYEEMGNLLDGHLEHAGACLSPAVCYSYYPTLSNKGLEALDVATAVSRCYRFESGRLEGLSRLWEFTMRELIFVGSANDVQNKRMKSLEAVWELAESWDLHAWVENANDPFFIGEFDSRAAFQRNREMKYELRLTVGEEFSVAATSFNFHSTSFGKAFNITLPRGNPACSGCCAWGLERWVLALFSHFGFEPGRWPAELAEAVW